MGLDRDVLDRRHSRTGYYLPPSASSGIAAMAGFTWKNSGGGIHHQADRELVWFRNTQAASNEACDFAPAPIQRGRWNELLETTYRSRTLIVWALWATAYFAANSLNNWMPSLYNTVYRLPLQQSLRAASMTNIAQVAILLLCAFYIDRIGRRNWTIVCFLIGAAALAVLGLTGARNVWSVIVLATFSYGVIGSVNAVLYLYTPEIYPTRMRAIGTGLATSWLRIASAVGPTIVGFMVAAQGVGSVFVIFAVTSLLGMLAAFGMIETRARRLEDIAP
jgi:putative MFS transporter